MENNNQPLVCVFDSGIGGINFLFESVRRLPDVNFAYFADNFRVPYGSMTRDKLIEVVDETFSEINKLSPVAALVACNTVTAQCINYLREKYSFKIVGVQPAVKPAAATGERCAVLATPLTASSCALSDLKEKYGNNRTKIYSCPDLAEYIENNIENISENEILKRLPDVRAENIVLGCTHYIFVSEIIKRRYNCPIFDGLTGTVNHLCEILGIFDHSATRAQKITFYGGDNLKNRKIFREMLKRYGMNSRL